MEVIYGLIPGVLLVGLIAVVVLFWAARSGQFDDLEGDGQRILMDEDQKPPSKPKPGSSEPDKASDQVPNQPAPPMRGPDH